ncbi:DUF1858 domain-containing protein [Desulfocucumis palustris]|nr:DUF1858 domain-containing protein [Desulfocucumis palustris]
MINENDRVIDVLEKYPAVKKVFSLYGYNCYG